MSANSRWPDISRVSSLFNPFGSKSAASDASSADHGPQSNSNAAASDAPARNGAPFEMMTDIHGQPIDGMGGFDDHYADDAPGDMESDFPPLEMFDSNAAEAPYSSMNAANFESNNQAPTAAMSVEESAPAKKSKKDKKKKKKDHEAEQPHEEGAHKRAKRKSTGEEELPVTSEEAPTGSLELGEEPHPSAQQSKRKRKSSDGADGKRKKRKSHAAPEAAEEAIEDESAGAFLKKDPKSGPAQLAVAVEDATGESDPQRSPTVAHLRRRSHSRSREPSVPHEPIDSQEVENVARQAWDEHINGNQNNEESADVPMPDANENDGTQNADEDIAIKNEKRTPGKRVSTRKKSKPSFFDQRPNGDDLPSPSAMAPKPRKRAKPATKKQKPQTPKLSQSMQGGTGDEYDEDQPRRKNRMEGFTKGRFTDDEMERLEKQIKEFGSENDMTPYQVNEMIHEPGGTQAGQLHSQLWSRLIAECPDRHRQKVINIVRKKFHNYVARGTWTPEQEEELRKLINVHGQSWSKIGGLINRHPEDIRDRFRNYIVCGDKQRRDAWTTEEEGELVQHIVASMASIDELRAMQPSRKLLQKSYEELIDWQNISELMGRTRSRLQCITKWKAMNLKTHGKDQFSSLQPDSEITFDLEKARRQLIDMPAAERYRLILAIAKSTATTDSKISWSKLCDRAWRLEWQRKTLVLLWNRLKKTVPGWERMPTKEVAQHLVDTYDRTDELPDVDGDNYNDVEEMQVLQTLAAPHARSDARKKSATNKSSEMLTGSDLENDEEQQEEQGEQELQIDPALVSAIEQAADAQDAPVEEAAAAPEETPVSKRTPGKKLSTYSKKRGSSKKATAPSMLSQDSIEDSTDPSQELPQLPPPETQNDVDDPAPKKKAAKGKGARARKRAAKSAEMAPNNVSSDMEDMEDLPATAEAAE